MEIKREVGMNGAQDIEYTVQIWKEGRQFVAHAMPLDVMSSDLSSAGNSNPNALIALT